MQGADSDAAGLAPHSLVGGRYRVLDQLGRGGMACVYRAHDITTQRTIALKRLVVPLDEAKRRAFITLFEREYHTLAQLAHPRVVEVYDCGLDDAGPYYTMELLDRGDLRDRSPMPWHTACELAFDVCSALALVHSRRLVHRDLSPRNVRFTLTNNAKLIDFGALAPIGPNNQVVGTPSFIAPEALHGGTLDARTDLYSLGATLYFTLTGYAPYPAGDIADLTAAWGFRPTPPSARAPDVPPELDALIMALLSLDPTVRPPSAFEVMQRLGSIADLDRNEPLSVSRAYLITPTLVGREQTLAIFRSQLTQSRSGRGGGFFVEAGPGLGRSRLLDACVVEAKSAGGTALRVGASAGRFAAARVLSQHLLDFCPELALSAARDEAVFDSLFEISAAPTAQLTPSAVKLRPWNPEPGHELELQTALERWFLSICQRHDLLIAVDDVDRIDPESLALLAALAHRARDHHLLVCASAESTSLVEQRGVTILAGHCSRTPLQPLAAEETEALLTSLFGDAANMSLLSARVHALANGRPRECMALAQHLVDRGLITYAAGIWTLPEQVKDGDLPSSIEELFRQRVDSLSAGARRLAEVQALATFAEFRTDDYARLAPGISAQQLYGYIDELITQQIVTGDGQQYALTHQAVRYALLAAVGADKRRDHHRALADLYLQSGTWQLAAVQQLLLGEQPRTALDLLAEVLDASVDSGKLSSAARMTQSELARVLAQAHLAALKSGWAARPLCELRRWLILLSFTDPSLYTSVAGPLLAQLEHDTGLEFLREQDPAEEPGQRLARALQHAAEQYASAPEAERVYRVDEAIKYLVHYVVASIAVGAHTLNMHVLASLPALLEPFAALSPVLHAIWQNSLATVEGLALAQPDRARARWIELYALLGRFTDQELQHVSMVRHAVAFGVGALEAQLGLESAGVWAAILDRDPAQRVNAMYLRKTVCMLRGDFAGADSFRRQAEVLGLQANSTQMFTNLVTVELGVHAAANDLTGVKRVRDRIATLATKYADWQVYLHLADGLFQRLRGELEAACDAFVLALPLCELDCADDSRVGSAWPRVVSVYIETLLERGHYDEAWAHGQRALQRCDAHRVVVGRFEIERAVALAEARQNEHSAAASRLEALIRAQRELGVRGLNLGLSYEARARIAIWTTDHAAIEQYARLTAEEYRHGHKSSLGTRYERLLLEARAAGMEILPPARDLQPGGSAFVHGSPHVTAVMAVARKLEVIADPEQQLRESLELLCHAYAAASGHLYLMREEGLVHAAAHAAEPPSEFLGNAVAEFWIRQRAHADLSTAVLLPAGSHVTIDRVWTDPLGISLLPVLLHCAIAGVHRHVGVLVVMADPCAMPTTNAPEIATAVATHLVRSGAATGSVV